MSRKGIDYNKTCVKQDGALIGDVIDEVTAIPSLIICVDGEELPTIHRIDLGRTNRVIDCGHD